MYTGNACYSGDALEAICDAAEQFQEELGRAAAEVARLRGEPVVQPTHVRAAMATLMAANAPTADVSSDLQALSEKLGLRASAKPDQLVGC